MAIRSFTLPKIAQTKVLELLSEIPLPQYYRSYDWGNDRWESGFQDIVCLECTMIDAAKRNCITKEHLLQIARWEDTFRIDFARPRQSPSLYQW